jgi:TonB family protein
LRSIAVVPIFESNEAAGILEVFASKPHAFDDRHLEILQQLAELVTTVTGRVTQNNQDAIAEAVLRPGSKEQPEIRTSQVKSYASPSRSERLRKWMASIALRDLLAKRLTKWTAPVASPRYYAAAIAVFALAGLLTILSWKPWHRTERSVVPSTKILPQAQPVPADAATIETRRQLNIVEPGAVSRSVRPQPAASPIRSDHSSKGPAQKVALVEPVSGEDDVKATITVPSLSGQTRGSLGSANDREPQAQAPSIGTAGGFGKDKDDKDVNVLDSALSVRATLPFMASQGVSGGTLEREVQPIYPAQARSERLQGPVVLRALIDEGGEVRNLKTVSGDAVLAQAAIEAVHQWHYQPYLLNGQPVKMPIQITVNFTLP